MLQTLYVKNLALIDEVEVELRNGLNILTGETGAGKSIIIDSIVKVIVFYYSNTIEHSWTVRYCFQRLLNENMTKIIQKYYKR